MVEPSKITVGDSLGWTRDHSEVAYIDSSGDEQECSATAWTLKYYAAGPEGAFSITASATGQDFLVSLTATETASWSTGFYEWRAYAISGANRYQIDGGKWELLPDFTKQIKGYESRTHARIVLDAINAVIEGKATQDQMSLSIAGRSLSRYSWQELLFVKAQYQELVKQEDAEEAAKRGENASQRILVRFGEWE